VPPSATSLIVLPPIASNRCAFSFWLAVGEGCRPRRRAVSLAVLAVPKGIFKNWWQAGAVGNCSQLSTGSAGMFCSGRGGQGRNPEGAVPRLALGAAALSMPGTGHRARWCRAGGWGGPGESFPRRGAALGGGRDAGLRVKGAAPCQSRGTLAAFHTETPLWGVGVKYSRS
jgi:hypothetical protein